MTGPALQVEQLYFRYGGMALLHGVSLQLDRGQFGAVIGSNGAGKSTLMKLLLGELRPASGSIRLLGQELSRFRAWPRVGYVPQNGMQLAVGFPATAGEVVLANLYSHIGAFRPPGRAHREQAAQALARVGMKDCAGQLVGTLSGGQLQRVLVARAIVAQPELLLLDEPTAGVDAQAADSMCELLSGLNRELGLTILMITHDLARVARRVDRVFCLEDGTVVELEPSQIHHELEHKHKHPPAQ